MPTILAPIAVATSTDGLRVTRFGHDNPVVAIDSTGTRNKREAAGCCGSLAQAVADCEVVICTAIGGGAAGHLAHAGVRLVLVPEGTEVMTAIAQYRAGRLVVGGEPSSCDHGHHHEVHGACANGAGRH